MPKKVKTEFPRKMITRLGKVSDRSLADEFGILVHKIRRERIRRGIRAWQLVEWTSEQIAVLGTISDEQAAKVVGVTNSAAFTKRVSLGIPAFGLSRKDCMYQWRAPAIRKLGKDSDAVIAEKLGVSSSVVFAKRESLGIPASRPTANPRRPWTAHELSLLGKNPDTVVSEETKRGRRHVRAKRESLGIPPFQQQKSIHWSKAIIRRMGKVTNAELAKELGVSQGTVALHRRRLTRKRDSRADGQSR